MDGVCRDNLLCINCKYFFREEVYKNLQKWIIKKKLINDLLNDFDLADIFIFDCDIEIIVEVSYNIAVKKNRVIPIILDFDMLDHCLQVQKSF